jgi:hypothetical protein
MAQAGRHDGHISEGYVQRSRNFGQLGFFGARGARGASAASRPTSVLRGDSTGRAHAPASGRARTQHDAPLCAGCGAREARYGFRRHDDDPTADRPRTLCFECFRMELTRRQAVSEQLARGWNASQVSLPLEQTLNELTRRRRRAQIAARKALEE